MSDGLWKVETFIVNRDSRSRYSGSFRIYPPNSGKPSGGGSVKIRVLSFDDSDGSPARWSYHASYSY